MKKLFGFIFIAVFLAGFTPLSWAAEHGGHELGAKEHGGSKVLSETTQAQDVTITVASADLIREDLKSFIEDISKATGTYAVYDPKIKTTRKLTLQQVHQRVGKTGKYYYSCVDFKDTKSGELLDLDFDIEFQEGKFTVVDVRIHKVDGRERYTYDKNDNRITVKADR